MNAKRVKSIRKAMRAAKMDRKEVNYLDNGGTRVLNPYCGRALYKSYKKKMMAI